jgi:hypothetical protein
MACFGMDDLVRGRQSPWRERGITPPVKQLRNSNAWGGSRTRGKEYELARAETTGGACCALFMPEIDRLFDSRRDSQ